MHLNTLLWGFGSSKRGIPLGCITQGMSRAGSSADDEKPDDEKIHVCKRIRSSAFETSQTPLLNDVPRPVRCAVCKKELGAKGEGEETIEALMISHLHRAGFKTKLHLHPAAGRTSFCIAEPKYYHIVCREHGELHQQQKKMWSQKKYPKHGHQDPMRGPGNTWIWEQLCTSIDSSMWGCVRSQKKYVSMFTHLVHTDSYAIGILWHG